MLIRLCLFVCMCAYVYSLCNMRLKFLSFYPPLSHLITLRIEASCNRHESSIPSTFSFLLIAHTWQQYFLGGILTLHTRTYMGTYTNIFTQPTPVTGCDTRSNFKQCKFSLNSIFLFQDWLLIYIYIYIYIYTPGNGVASSPTPRCSSYWKGSLHVTLDYGCQLFLHIYICVCACIYIYIRVHVYICVCVCVCIHVWVYDYSYICAPVRRNSQAGVWGRI